MTLTSDHLINLRLKWIAEYHGPNVCAGSAAVLGELTGEVRGDVAQLKVACAKFWAQSGMDWSVADAEISAGEDVLTAVHRVGFPCVVKPLDSAG